MKISIAVATLHVFLPSSISYSPPQYRGLFSLRAVQAEFTKNNFPFHRSPATPATLSQYEAKSTRDASLTTLGASSEEINGSTNIIDVRYP